MNQSHIMLSEEKDRTFRNLKLLLETADLPQSASQLMLLNDILSYKIETERSLQRRRGPGSSTSEKRVKLTAKV
jgi:hypothetical protein